MWWVRQQRAGRHFCLALALAGVTLACAGGEPLPDGPIGEAPVPVPVAPEHVPITPVMTGDAVLDAYQYDCHAEIGPADPSGGEDECRTFEGLADLPVDPFGCVDRALLCGSGCGSGCAQCQERCAGDCDLCKRPCEDAACVQFCAEGRAACRLVCMRDQAECARGCVEDIPRCNESAADERDRMCPHCEQILRCFEDRDAVKICQKKYPEEDERCFTWCAAP